MSEYLHAPIELACELMDLPHSTYYYHSHKADESQLQADMAQVVGQFTRYGSRRVAHQILRRQSLDLGSKPMEAALWTGAVDNVGGEVLTWLTRTVGYGGNIASVGLAGGAELKTTVMPFLLRGVNLLGINSVFTPRATRLAVWERIAGDLRPRHLERIADRIVPLADLPAQFDDYLKGRVTGRTVVRIP